MKSNNQKSSTNATDQFCVQSQGDTLPKLMPWTAPKLSILNDNGIRESTKAFMGDCFVEDGSGNGHAEADALGTRCNFHNNSLSGARNTPVSNGNNMNFGPS